MKGLRYNSLPVALIISIFIHFAIFRFASVKPVSEKPGYERFEVRLVYNIREPVRLQEPQVKRKSVAEKTEEDKREEYQIDIVMEENHSILMEEYRPEEGSVQSDILLDDKAETIEEVAFYSDSLSSDSSSEKKGELKGGVPVISEKLFKVEEKTLSGTIGGIRKPEERPGTDFTVLIEELSKKINTKKVYPYIARKKGLEGTVIVTLKLDKDGKPLEIKVTRSSGQRVLDNAARSLIERVVPYQHGLGRPVTIEIPVRYSLLD